MDDEPKYEYDVRVNEGFLLGVTLGTLASLATGPFGFATLLAGLFGSCIGSAAVIKGSGDNVVTIRKYRIHDPSCKIPDLLSQPMNPEKIGYINARRWKEPFTAEQQARLDELFE